MKCVDHSSSSSCVAAASLARSIAIPVSIRSNRLGKLPLGSEAAVAGLSGEDVKHVKQMRMQNAEVCFRSLHIDAFLNGASAS